ncbi:hypothetical protein [Fusibacter sp. 3D3]|uniref:hypothetical protein n=1 Tax=Fusibacter sp. 3D3 TaxID=1048380 RepID=UPI0008536104|nr:hypothetical protein [Fusibacter sp. 3D3]GAU77863.1 hypothetical protein F3D3_2492 [Fusibacter sp. 3D3]
MGIEQVIVFSLLLILTLFFFVVIMDYMVPLYLDFEFNGICRSYALLIEAQNGLDEDQKNSFIEALKKRHVTVTQIECSVPSHIKKGDWIHFSVVAENSRSVFKALFERETKTYVYKFTQEIVSNKASN